MGRRAVVLELTRAEERQLEAWSQVPDDIQLAQALRAQIILLAAAGLANAEIAYALDLRARGGSVANTLPG